jgi:hypothetical protein
MFNPQSFIITVSYSKVNVNVYVNVLRAQQIFITVWAILTRNGVMNHHMQRELTMAEKRVYGDMKLIQNARAENRWWPHAAPQPNERPPPPAADIVQVLDLPPQHDRNPPHRPPPQDSDDILLELVRQTFWRTGMHRLGGRLCIVPLA